MGAPSHAPEPAPCLASSPEGPGLKAATEGIHAGYADDQARLDAAMPLYDAFYTYCREVIAHGKPNGAFKP